MDEIDKILMQWNNERPDLDVRSMGLIGRFLRVTHQLSREMDKTFTKHGLNLASFDMLATLRRSGPPYRLSPSALMEAMMVTSGTMTNRIDQLCKAGFVERMRNPDDGRGFIITLTEKGFAVIDPAVTEHVETQTRLTSGLSDNETADLNRLLSNYLIHLKKPD